MDKKRALPTVVAVVAVLALVGTAVGLVLWRSSGQVQGDGARPVDPEDPAAMVAERFAAAWVDGSLQPDLFVPVEPPAADQIRLITAGLTPVEVDAPTSVEITDVSHGGGADAASGGGTDGAGSGPGPTATARAEVTWDLGGGRTWSYQTSFLLRERPSADGGRPAWAVAFDPVTIAPGLRRGELLRAERRPGARGRIVDATGRSLVGEKGSVVVGIRKSRTDDPAGTARTVAALTGVDADDLLARVAAAGDDEFVEVVTMARADYDRIRAQIQPLPGTVFQELDPQDDLPANFARGLLGTTGPATQEVVDGADGRVALGEITGLSGLQAAQDEVLAGSPGLAVQALPAAPGSPGRTLRSFDGAPGRDVAITIDPKVQIAADAAVATTEKPSALVAIRVSTGDVLAVANGPAGASAYNRAMLGRYPPGSVFKVVSALGLLERGLTPDTVVDCPATIVVGKRFRNAEGEVLGPVPFREDFAHSCNTAFVGESKDLSSADLAATAAKLGYRDLDIGMPLFGGSVPVTDDTTEHAADMIGQGKVEGSVLTVALASASVASGRSLEPRLIIDPARPTAPGDPLPAEPVAHLRDLMREVVVSGTGRGLQGVPGGPVHGKTGTAEFGTETPPRTHAWFTGYQGDIAFAVLVEDGGFGGAVAAPVAARFLTDLAG